MSDIDFDDHEPGDINGNIDPAYAKKQKQQTRNQERKANRPKRPVKPKIETNEPTVTQSAGLGASESGGVVTASSLTNGQGTDASAVVGNGGGTRESRQPRSRGLRRNRRGPRRDDRDGPQLSSTNVVAEAVADGEAGAAGGEEHIHEPNPGAFGDPSRPMDRSARRNRNQRDRREHSANNQQRNRQRKATESVGASQIDPLTGQPIAVGMNTDGSIKDGERLHKVLAQQGLGSRRDMEAMIAAGEVEVNGVKAHVGQVVNEADRVHVKRRKVKVKLGDDKPRIMIYHKPAGEIVSRDDPEQRDTVFDRLPRPDHGKWVAIGRLDYNSEGLLLFTTYGELANRFMHPSYQILRDYSVRVLGELTPEQEDMLVDGIELEDGPARVLSLDRIDRDSDGANHWYKLTLQEGRNREVRRMFEHLGLTVSRLIRTSYGVVNMPSWLKRGQFKQLDEAEVFNVLESVGLRSKKKAEKAARYGGKNRLPAQPLGPMRTATEHEAILTGVSPDAHTIGGAGRGRNTGKRAGGYGARTSALQQQQFPGFGGASELQQTPTNKRRGPMGANRKRQGGGDVNGNVAPGYRADGSRINKPKGQGGFKKPQSGKPGNRTNARAGQEGIQGADGANVGGSRHPARRRRNGPRPAGGTANAVPKADTE